MLEEEILGGSPRSTEQSNQPEAGNHQRSPASLVIGIGASAGGLEALRALLARLSPPVCASIVVVQHMSPSSRSMLAELLSRETEIAVDEASDGELLEENRIYITPPNAHILVQGNRIRLCGLEERAGPKPSIDRFLTSLATEFDDRSIACILSGTGNDGTQGLRAIKAAGGLALVQDPGTAKYDGMPSAAISTGMVDLVLSPTDMAKELNACSLEGVANRPADFGVADQEHFRDILRLIHKRSKVNFALYKPNTINRRLQRRVAAIKAGGLDEYLDYLRKNPTEIDKLHQDILISVTSFFRDGEQFRVFGEHLRSYIENNAHRDSIRIWSAGCASGEEPYSLAMLALEALEELGRSAQDIRIQVFATDINDAAMNTARAGLFPATSVEVLPRHLIKRYFVNSEGGYRVKKELRDMVLFARHDLTADPPFLKMDVISCRNLFIYFDPKVQERVLKIFHYALNQSGLLFLGKSESLGQDKSFFRTLDSNAKLFERSNRTPAASMSFARLRYPNHQVAAGALHPNQKSRSQLERDLVREFCPDSIMLSDDFRIIAVYGDGGRYLHFPDGPMDQKLEALLNPAVRSQVMTVVHRSRRSNQIIRGAPILFSEGERRVYIHVAVYPISAFDDPRFVLGFHTVKADEQEFEAGGDEQAQPEVEELERELMATREHLQSVIEEQETSNEELQALNEELQSANEELQSSNEELETSNEELQSSNEELTTLNEELNVKTQELSDLSAHLNAVQDAIVNPVLVIDANLNLVNFNERAGEFLKLSSENVGRNFRLINSPFGLEPVFKIIEDCLLNNRWEETRLQSGDCDLDAFSVPIRRENDGSANGVVTTLVDNTMLRQTLRRADAAKRSMYRLMQAIPAKVTVRDASGVYTYANPAFCQTLGLSEEEIIGRTDVELFGEETGRRRRQNDLAALQSESVRYDDELRPGGNSSHVYHTARVPLLDDDGRITSVCSVGVDISDRAFAEQRLREVHNVITRAEDGFLILKRTEQGLGITFVSETLVDKCQLGDRDLSTLELANVLNSLDPGLTARDLDRIAEAVGREVKCSFHFSDIHRSEPRYFDLKSCRVDDEKIFVTIFDVTETKLRDIKLKAQEEKIEKSGRLAALGQMAAGIAHELKTPLSTIQGYADLIRELGRNGAGMDPQIAQAVDNIEATTTKMSDIIVGLKSVARSSHAEAFEPCDVNELVDETLKMCMFRLKNKGIEVSVESAATAPQVQAQPTQLSQVLINLVNNSVDAIQDYREKWIRLQVQETDNEAVVRVTDSGQGISRKVLKQVMTPFFTTKRDGTGLGLSLSQSIVKAHGGMLEVEHSCPNTCFVLRLPKGQPAAQRKRRIE